MTGAVAEMSEETILSGKQVRREEHLCAGAT